MWLEWAGSVVTFHHTVQLHKLFVRTKRPEPWWFLQSISAIEDHRPQNKLADTYMLTGKTVQ